MEENTNHPNTGHLKAKIEILIIFFLGLAVFLIAGKYDLLEKLVTFSAQHENWEMDEFLIVPVYLVLASAVFSYRRWRDLQKSEFLLTKQNRELNRLLSEIKQLRGIIPICAECKDIRDDKGYWHQVESYVRDHSEAEFSHGLCPKCIKKLYPEFDEDKQSSP